MKVFLTGASGVMGRSAMTALVDAGHEVVGLARSDEAAQVVRDHGAEPRPGSIFDRESLVRAMRRCDAVLNFASHAPVGHAMVRPGAWRAGDRIRRLGSLAVSDAAVRTGIGLLVQQSRSALYADAGDAWIDEHHPVAISRATDAIADAEQHARFVQRHGGHAVVLRFGLVTGTDPASRWMVRRARSGRPTGWGEPRSWVHLVHGDDVGPAVVAALGAPAGTYNVGAAPCRREDLAEQLALAGGRRGGRFHNAATQRLARHRLEIYTRSQRVSSQRFADRTGWHPQFPKLTPEWFDGVDA